MTYMNRAERLENASRKAVALGEFALSRDLDSQNIDEMRYVQRCVSVILAPTQGQFQPSDGR